MTFAAWPVLLALLGLPVLLALYVRGERRRGSFASAAVMPSVLPRRAGWRRHVSVLAYGLAIAVLVVAVARPQVTRAVPAEQASVVLVADRSGSMQATDVAPSRLVAVRQAAEGFLDAVPSDVRVGAIAFNQTAQVLATPTRNHEAVRAAVTTVPAAGSTATGDALAAALRLVRTGEQDKTPAAIVLLSDGKSVRGRDPLVAAEEAKRAGVPVYTVSLGTPGGTIQVETAGGGTRAEPVPPDPETLRRIAEGTGGESFAVEDADRLGQVFERLGSEVAKERRKEDVGGAFAGGALLLLASGFMASLRWFGRAF